MENVVALEQLRMANQKRKSSKDPARVISITSGKGGVGKTNTTVNVGLSLVNLGKRVLLLDADLGLANINILLGFEPSATIHDVVAGKAKLEDVIVNYDYGLDIIPASSGIPELTNLSQNERLSFVELVDSLAADYDYVLVDTAAGIGDNVIYFNVASEDKIVVIDHEPTSITDAYAVIKVLSTHHNIREFYVIANKTPVGSDGRKTYAKLAAATDRFLNVNLKYLGSIAADELVSKSVIDQKACVELYPSSKAGLDFAKIAKKLIDTEGQRKPSGGLQFFFKELLENS